MHLYFITGKRLATDVDKKLKTLQQLARQVSITHDMEDIHQLRVTYKKLRALVRMAQATRRNKGLHPGLKKLYSAAGTVRDLQIHHQTVSAYFQQYNTLPVHYLQHIHQEIKEGSIELNSAYQHFSFSRARKLLQRQFRGKLRRKNLARWHKGHTDAIRIPVNNELQDEQIHDIRKHIKELLYAADYVLPDDSYKDAAHILGEFMDSCVLLSLLDKHTAKAAPGEIKMLAHARLHWEADKMRQQEKAREVIKLIAHSPTSSGNQDNILRP